MFPETILRLSALLLFLASPIAVLAEKFYTYIGAIGPDHVLLAWGTTRGDNTIGRSSRAHGTATVRIGDQTVTATVHAPRPASNDSMMPGSVDSVTSSRKTPMPCTAQSLTYEMDSSTWLPA